MNPPDPLAPLGGNTGPIFDEPWHAQVLAIADAMVAAGHFSATDWAQALGVARSAAETRGDPDSVQTYYLCAVEALEALVARSTPISAEIMARRKETWSRAYLATPHGKPVTLAAADR